MLGKKMVSLKKLAKKVNKATKGSCTDRCPSHQYRESLLSDPDESPDGEPSGKTPTGFLAVYVGDERRRFVVPTSFLSHPLFKMLLDKAHDEFGFRQTNGLVVPCSVSAFQEVVNAVERSNCKFDFGKLVEEFL